MDLQPLPNDALATSYLRHWQLSTGIETGEPDELRALRPVADEIDDAADSGTLPIGVLDALIQHPHGSPSFRAYVAAGPVEQILTTHADRYADELAERCRRDERWAETLAAVWLDKKQWRRLPDDLRRVIPQPKR
ncbi:MAG: hypothetical protein R2733_18280 [Acidimicrobiales bacterium]